MTNLDAQGILQVSENPHSQSLRHQQGQRNWDRRFCRGGIFADLPLDILYPILEHLSDSKDWCVCAVVNKTFNKAATPLLYRNLDTRIISKSVVLHPASTLLKRPELASYVHHVTESGALHLRVMSGWSDITEEALKAISLCTSLKSFTWTDDSRSQGFALIAFLNIMKGFPAPLEELNIRTHNALATEVWDEINKVSGLKRVSIWCMEGPPRVLQGWSELLGPTLTHLELGRCAGVPKTILIAVLLHLPHLEELRLKGAPASVITSVLAILPNLQVLDTEYLPSFGGSHPTSPSTPPPALQSLTVRTSSGDYMGPSKLWPWMLSLIPGPEPSLQVFCLHSFIMNVMGKGSVAVPRSFIWELGRLHGDTIKEVLLGDAQLMLGDIECLFDLCPEVEVLTCGTVVEAGKVDLLKKAISVGQNLRSLTLQVVWIPDDDTAPTSETPSTFDAEDAKDLMLRSKGSSKLRFISMNDVHYKGKWVLRGGHVDDQDTRSGEEGYEYLGNGSKLEFVVTTDVPKRWYLKSGAALPGISQTTLTKLDS